MRKRREYTVLVSVGLLLAGLTIAGSASATPARHALDNGHADVQRVLDRAVTEADLPGIVAEIRDEHRRWFGTAGVADTATGRQRQPQDRFRVGSITKTFTATVLLQLVAEHRISLDDTVERWLPGVVRGNGHDGRQVIVRQLLNHTSGIFNYVMDPDLVAKYYGLPYLEHRFDSISPDQLVRIAMGNPPAFTPGMDWGYSNTNYVLAGMIIEKASGRTLADQVTQRIVRPLGLKGTYVPVGDDPSIQGPHGRHYSKLMLPNPDAGIYDVTEQNPSGGWAAGNVISTAQDLNTLFRALLHGRLLPPAQQREMFTTVATHGWIDNTTYGLGMSSVTLSCDVTLWGMGGAINGSWSYTYGTRDGTHMLTTNVNGDWAGGKWPNPIGIFTDVLHAEFCPHSPQKR